MAHILVVDDEESIRFTFASFLTDAGHSVDTAESFDQALERMSGQEYDLIFMDILLGGQSGIDLLQEAKKVNAGCPVVMITGYPNVETATGAVRHGAFDYIAKPVRQETLLRSAEVALKYRTLQQENENIRLNLTAIFRSVKDAIITVDSGMTLIESNDAAYSLCGIARDNIGKNLKALNTHCSGKCLVSLQKTIDTHMDIEVQRIECEQSGHNRQVVTVNSSPLISTDGKFSGAVMVIRDETRINNLEQDLLERRKFHHMVGQNTRMQKIYSLIEALADVQTTVLILGESGTGKELVAEAIHYKGCRSSQSMIKVNCAALPENLLESELFGHVKGSFTGADSDRIGRFQKADHGTIFLDEIGDISPRMQLRLLRVLQEKVIEQVGDSSPVKVDVRVIAATNQDLAEKVKSGEFREDLYYRLKVVEIALPPLRERKDDIMLIVDAVIKKFNARYKKHIQSLSDNVKELFLDYAWPGNIRELEHTLEHAFVVAQQDIITMEHLPESFADLQPAGSRGHLPEDTSLGKETLLEALNKAGWNKARTARMLGVNVRTIYRKIEKYNIKTEEV